MERALIVYYSFSGNTERVATQMKTVLDQRFQTEVVRVEALDESSHFFGQARRAFFKTNARIPDNVLVDVSPYAVVAVGTPVWAFGAACAIRTWLGRCRGMAGKRVLMFATYGSGAGSRHCVAEMAHVARTQKAAKVDTLLIQQGKCRDAEALRSILREALREC